MLVKPHPNSFTLNVNERNHKVPGSSPIETSLEGLYLVITDPHSGVWHAEPN